MKPLFNSFAVRLAFFAVSLVFSAASANAQSAPGYQAPDKPKQPGESLQTKAARGQAPLRKLYDYLTVDPAMTKRLPALDEREKEKKLPNKVLRIGAIRNLPNPVKGSTDGASYQIAEGDVRVFGIISEGALYTRVQFVKMTLPKGARVFVYSMNNPNEYYGPYEGRGLSEDGTFWTPPMKGDGVVIEYFVPKGAEGIQGMPFKVSRIGHVYADPIMPKVGGCHNEVVAPWTDTAKSVGRLDFTTGGGIGLCTGTLLNDNVASTAIPYVLTANHCFSTQTEAQSLRVWWNYNTGNSPPAGTPFTDGANLLVTGASSDFTFVRLTGTVPGGLFFSGWEASTFSGTASSAGIHHPDGSHKRISFGTARQPTPGECGGSLPCLAVDWNQTANPGVTETGSSGSGLWKGLPTDPGGALLIGTLTGGPSVCGGSDLRDVYGRFSVTYPNISSFLEGTSCVTSLNPTSQNFSKAGGAGSVNVTAPSGCNWTAVRSDAFVTITSGSSGAGNGTVNFSVAANSGAQRSATIVVGGQVFNITQSGGDACAPTPITFGQTINGSLSTSDCPLDDGSFYDIYSFTATAGTQVSVLMQSAAFDTYLFLNRPDGSNLAQDDDGVGGGSTNSRIPPSSGTITLTQSGTYTIWANSFLANQTGPYSVTLSGTPPPTRTLTVASSNPSSGVNITVSPNDNGGLGNGTTQFTRTYNPNINVHLQAPAVAPGGSIFQEWRRDGVFFTSNAQTIVVMDIDHTMTAVYRAPIVYTVTFVSSPTNGVAITVSPNDNNGQGNGTTQFTRQYNETTVVNLFAPATHPSTGNPFQWWQKDSSVYSSTQNISVTMTGSPTSFTMTAVYRVPPVIFAEENTNNLVALNSVTFVRGPFRVADSNNFGSDQNTRIVLLTSPLGLTQADLSQPNIVMVEAGSFIFPVEAVGPLLGVPGLNGSYLVFKLPANSPTGAIQITVRLRGLASDPRTLNIIP
ncbi:MAG: pre-peptidase C-terminal domain-containing protein [Acidobacteriota bacterium]